MRAQTWAGGVPPGSGSPPYSQQRERERETERDKQREREKERVEGVAEPPMAKLQSLQGSGFRVV